MISHRGRQCTIRNASGEDGCDERHLLVDVIGLILVLVVTPASVQDRDGAVPVLEQAALEHSSLRKVWADGAYHGRAIDEARARTNIEIEMVKRSDDMKGFVVLPEPGS